MLCRTSKRPKMKSRWPSLLLEFGWGISVMQAVSWIREWYSFLLNLILTDAMKNAVRTELTLEPSEFDSFHIGVETTITFSLKELRALLSFAEFFNIAVSGHFDTPGRWWAANLKTRVDYKILFPIDQLYSAWATRPHLKPNLCWLQWLKMTHFPSLSKVWTVAKQAVSTKLPGRGHPPPLITVSIYDFYQRFQLLLCNS